MNWYTVILIHIPIVTMTGVPAEPPRKIFGPVDVLANDPAQAKGIVMAQAAKALALKDVPLEQIVGRYIQYTA